MRKLKEKLNKPKYVVMQWKTKAGNFTTNKKVKVNLCLPEFSATKIVT